MKVDSRIESDWLEAELAEYMAYCCVARGNRETTIADKLVAGELLMRVCWAIFHRETGISIAFVILKSINTPLLLNQYTTTNQSIHSMCTT